MKELKKNLSSKNKKVSYATKNYWQGNTGCFKKSFTTLKAYTNLFRRHVQRFELS
jgi:hypothetical protein